MKPMLHFCHNDFYFGLVALLLCSFRACWLCYLCSCWYFSFGLPLLDVSFLFLHISYVVVGASCGLLLLLLSHYSFCSTTLLALFLYIIALHTFTPLLAAPHVVDPLMLASHPHQNKYYSIQSNSLGPFLSCCHSVRTSLLALLLLSCRYSSHVALLALSLLLHFKRLLTNFCCSFRTTILDPFTLLLLCLVSVNIVLPLPLPCASRSSKVWHQLKHQMWILLHIFDFFEFLYIIVVLCPIFLFYFFFCCCNFCNFANFFSIHFVLFLLIMYQFFNFCVSLFFCNFKKI